MQAVIPNDANNESSNLSRVEIANADLHRLIAERVADCSVILAARAYGSSLYREKAVDFDTAVLIPDTHGVVPMNVYVRLKRLRDQLVYEQEIDLDLVPHTADEFTDHASPLWNPRYNPSLVFGRDIKEEFPVGEFMNDFRSLTAADQARTVLHDNRTITRRQLLRTIEGECGRIYVSKLLHGPGNGLTVHACRTNQSYLLPPSDLRGSLELFDQAYSCDSRDIYPFLERCRGELNYRMALGLMQWHEYLFRLVMAPTEESARHYTMCCQSLGLAG
jgi:hypothetical protein